MRYDSFSIDVNGAHPSFRAPLSNLVADSCAKSLVGQFWSYLRIHFSTRRKSPSASVKASACANWLSPTLSSPSSSLCCRAASQATTQSLAELTTQIGEWMLRVCGAPHEQEYRYTSYHGQEGKGKVLICRFVSEDSSQHCLENFKRTANGPEASGRENKFQDRSIWKVSKVTLTNDKTLYTVSPIRIVIDMNATTLQLVLQSTTDMPVQATPPEQLATLLEPPNHERVDTWLLW